MDRINDRVRQGNRSVLARVLLLCMLIAATSFLTPVSAQTASTTVISQVGSSANDAEENLKSGNVDLTDTDLQLGELNNTPQLVGVRFTNITIPRGAVIVSAYVEFEATDTDSIPTSITIQGQATDNAPAFVSTKDNISTRSRTSAQISWNKIPAWSVLNAREQTPNISAVIQEIVNRSNWTTGNSIVIMMDGSGRRTADSFDGQPSAAPKLVVDYSIPTPPPTPTSGSIRFAVIGDYGNESQPEIDVATLVKSWNPDFVITTGDNNYPDGAAGTIDPHIGQYYHQFIYPYTGTYGLGSTTNRFFPALGNHDWHAPNAQPYLDYFTLPGNERYYDYVRGAVHFFAVDSDSNEPDGNTSSSVQAAWLKNGLAASTSAWNLVYMHHPPYSSGANHGSTTTMQWPYAAWGADAVLAGHDHTYERIFQNGILYFVNGLGGTSIYSFSTPISGSQVRYDGDYGAMLVEASASQITFQFISRTGVPIDLYTLHKSSIPPTPTATPVTPTFADVPLDYWAYDYIERLYAAGITSGCGGGNYCPAAIVSRDQMAVFLLRAKYGSSYTPPAATGVFQDVPTSYWAADWIEQLAARGITSGCGYNPKLYCPTMAVSRDQMAIFLLRAKYGSSYAPPAATGMFEDVPTSYWAAGWIEQLTVEGVTGGCGGGKYCPTAPVTRDQMAVFLVKTFNLP